MKYENNSICSILKVLIVDDELPIREELRSFDWRGHGAIMVGECDNGADALEFCCNHFPDVVISDIEMPIMDGLTLFRRLKASSPNTQLIVLTCHKDFEYASQALRLGALDYIVKVNMQDKDLAEVLDKARASIQANQQVDIDKKRRRRGAVGRILKALCNHEGEPEQYKRQLESLEITLREPIHLPLLFFRALSRSSEHIPFELQKSLPEFDFFECEGYDWFPLSANCLLLWPHKPVQSLKAVGDKIHIISGKFQQTIDSQYSSADMQFHFAIGNRVATIMQIQEYLFSSPDWIDLPFYCPNTGIFLEPFPSYQPIPDAQRSEMWERGMQLRHDRTKLCSFIHSEFSAWACNGSYAPAMLRRFCNLWLAELLEEKQDIHLATKIDDSLNSTISLEELVDRMNFWLNSHHRKMVHPEILRALAVINEHLAEEVTLSGVAEEIGLSSHYLSRLFHSEIGQPFNRYITGKRIEKAAYYLKNSDLRIYEIAEKVGLPNYRYFSIVFKKTMDVTPLEYRKGSML